MQQSKQQKESGFLDSGLGVWSNEQIKRSSRIFMRTCGLCKAFSTTYFRVIFPLQNPNVLAGIRHEKVFLACWQPCGASEALGSETTVLLFAYLS